MRFHIRLDVFAISVVFYLGDKTQKRMEKAVDAKIGNNSAGYCRGNTIWLSDEAELPTLVHELYHAVEFLQEYLGVKCQETGAYMLGYVFEHAYPKFKSWKENKDK